VHGGPIGVCVTCCIQRGVAGDLPAADRPGRELCRLAFARRREPAGHGTDYLDVSLPDTPGMAQAMATHETLRAGAGEMLEKSLLTLQNSGCDQAIGFRAKADIGSAVCMLRLAGVKYRCSVRLQPAVRPLPK
jgi:hypothetical protein